MTGIADIPITSDAFFDAMLLARAKPRLIHMLGAQERTLPANQGTLSVRFRRYDKLAQNVTPLTEGTTPAGKTLGQTLVTVALNQYGDFTQIFDALAGISKEALFRETGDILADQAGESLDSVTRDVIYAGTSVDYANNRVSRVTVAAADVMDIGTIRNSVQVLKDADALEFTTQGSGTDQVGTLPIRPAYWGFMHTSQRQTFKQLAGFIEAHNYPSSITPLLGELGEVEGVRWIETTNGEVFTGAGAGGIDVYGSLIIAQNFHAVVNPSAAAPAAGEPASPLGLQFIAKPHGGGGAEDPLNQRSSAGWKGHFASVILNNAFGIRLEAALV